MAKPFSSRINKLNQLKKRLRLDNQKLLTYMDSDLTVHELELILGANDTIYLTQENVEMIEKAIEKAMAENERNVDDTQKND
jgi:cob(I)alamin adenosyltransferase